MKPTCDCVPVSDYPFQFSDRRTWWLKAVRVGNLAYLNDAKGWDVVDAYFPLRFCPQCGAPYKEENK